MDRDKDFVMVTVSGPDQPGITASFSKILVDNHAEIVDIIFAHERSLAQAE